MAMPEKYYPAGLAKEFREDVTFCKCCLMRKTREEIGVISETIVNQMLSRLTKSQKPIPVLNITPLKTCNDCVIDLLKADDLIIICRDSQDLLNCWWKMALRQQLEDVQENQSGSTEEENTSGGPS